MKHPLQFLEIPRRDPAKQEAEVRIRHMDEIYASYDSAEPEETLGGSSSCTEKIVILH